MNEWGPLNSWAWGLEALGIIVTIVVRKTTYEKENLFGFLIKGIFTKYNDNFTGKDLQMHTNRDGIRKAHYMPSPAAAPFFDLSFSYTRYFPKKYKGMYFPGRFPNEGWMEFDNSRRDSGFEWEIRNFGFSNLQGKEI